MSNIANLDYNRQGLMFTASNQSAKTVTLINTSTATGFILSNPFGSGKKLIIAAAAFVYTTVPSATSTPFLCLSVAPSSTAHATVTAETVYAADGSGAANTSVAKVYNASTTPNLPVYTRAMGYAPTTPATTGGITWRDYVEGAIIVVPGAYLQMSYLGAAPVGVTDMQWIELPI